MGANAVTQTYDFVANQILTAAQMDNVNCGIPVFATTITRDAAFGGVGEKVLAQGQMAFIEATNTTQYYDGSAWQTLGASGLSLVKSQVVGSAVASVQVTSAFSATYDNYLIMYNNGSSSTTIDLYMIVGATTSGYYWNIIGNTWSATASNTGSAAGSAWSYVGATDSTNGTNMALRVLSPFLAKRTVVDTEYVASTGGYKMTGMLNNTTSYTSFTITPNSGTLTGGTIRVYGYNI